MLLSKRAFYKCFLLFNDLQQEQEYLHQLYEKYVPNCIDMIIEGIVDGRQGDKLKTIVPLTNLNMVSLLLGFNVDSNGH